MEEPSVAVTLRAWPPPPPLLPSLSSVANALRPAARCDARGHLHRQALVAMPLAQTALSPPPGVPQDAFAMDFHGNRWTRVLRLPLLGGGGGADVLLI